MSVTMVEVNCATCGKAKTVRLAQWNVNKSKNFFCSDSNCYGIWKSKTGKGPDNPNWKGGKIQVHCEGCGKPIFISPGNPYEHHFCSVECRAATMVGSLTSRWRGGPVKLQCSVCGKDFFVKQAEADRGAEFCSHQCASIRRRNKLEMPCTNCGKLIVRAKSQFLVNRDSFCCMKCKMEYQVGPNSSNWNGGTSFEPYPVEFNAGLKHEIKKRDGFQCVICHRRDDGSGLLHIHHIDYNKFNNAHSNLITLCQWCHCTTNNDRDFWACALKLVMKNIVY
jgi:endogenous inhibitor of DNA gyrase (YacG/DUF329 family)